MLSLCYSTRSLLEDDEEDQAGLWGEHPLWQASAVADAEEEDGIFLEEEEEQEEEEDGGGEH